MKTFNLIGTIFISLIILVNFDLAAQKNRPTSLNSYEYKDAIGLRAGETSGFIFNHKFANDNAFEAILGIFPYNLGFTGLFEKFYKTGVPGLYIYCGGGAHVNFGTRAMRYYRSRSNEYEIRYFSDVIAIGGDGIFGVEYKFNPVPIAVGLDFKPFIEGDNYGYAYFSIDPGIKVKFTF